MDLTTQGIKDYMASATSEADWNQKTKDVKDANGGDYPGFWYRAIVLSGLAATTANKWNGSAEIKVTPATA